MGSVVGCVAVALGLLVRVGCEVRAGAVGDWVETRWVGPSKAMSLRPSCATLMYDIHVLSGGPDPKKPAG